MIGYSSKSLSEPQARLSRRRFLGGAALAVAAPMIVPSSVLGHSGAVAPSNRIVFANIGIGGRARHVMPCFLAQRDIVFTAVSDCRQDRLKSAKELIDAHYGNKDCRMYPDFRELLAQKDIDAVFIAIGDRWHTTASVYAARAGKDIYSEKPISMTISEGRSLVEACRRYGTIYQGGTQRRSTASYRFAVDMVRQGRIGRVHTVEMQVWTGPTVPHDKPTPVPKGWDYDTWLGPVQWRPFVPGRMEGANWNYFWDTGEGPIIGMGCHYTDQMQWALGRDHIGPVEFEGRCEWPDPAKFMSETPVTAEVRCRYADGVVAVMYSRKTFSERYIRYLGDEGWIQVDDETDQVTAEPKSILSLRGTAGVGWADAGDHVRNLLNSIRNRRPTICHPEAAHRAQTICQAMNINIRRGALSALLQLDEDSGRQRILDTIVGRDPALVPVAIARVGSLRCDDASQTFAELLPRLPPSAQVWMIEALAARGDAAARQAIHRQVDARDAGVRRAAVLAVGRLEDASAVALLAKMLASLERPEELQDVEVALAGLRGGTATDKALVAKLKQSSPEVKVRLISVLTRRNARVALPALLAEAGGSDIATVRAAFLSLGRVAAEDDLPALLEKLTSLKAAAARADAELAAARVVARMADCTRRSEIIRAALVKTSDVEARCSLLQLLSGAADARALTVLTAAGADPQPQVRDAAVRALAAWPDASGWDALLAILRRPENDTHRALALRAMTRLAGDLNARPDAALLDRYRQLLSGARGDDELKLILGALGGVAHPDALGLALPLVSRAGVRAEAQAAVEKIAESVRAEHPQAAQAAMEQLKQTKP